MNRRGYLGALAGALGAGLAGCAGGDDPTPTATPTPGERTATPGAVTVDGVDLPVAESELHLGAFKDAIPAITDPEFADSWEGYTMDVSPDGISTDYEHNVEPRLADDDPVLGVATDRVARAYPLRVLRYFEVVDDVVPTADGERPVAVTYCPLCRSGLVADRTVDGERLTFGVSGLLWRSNLVLYDTATRSLWSQRLATAIRGPMTGTRLEPVPFTRTTWGDWRAGHPDGEVLLPPPASDTITGREVRDYTENPYDGYDEANLVGVGFNDFEDARMHPKTVVVGVAADGAARAYPLGAVRAAGGSLLEETVGDRPVVVATGPGETLVAHDRRVDGETLSFERADRRHLRAGGSRWEVGSGEAVDGPHEGRALADASDGGAMFWFSWVDFHPDTTVFGRPREGGDDSCDLVTSARTTC